MHRRSGWASALVALGLCLAGAPAAAQSTFTTHYNLAKPATGDPDWGATLNANADLLDTTVFARSPLESFRGLHLRTHPDSDVAASKVMLVTADEVILDDGTRVTTGLSQLVADITASGAGGLDTGTEAGNGASVWYEIHLIRKPSDGSLALLLHRARDFFTDANQGFTTADDAVRNLRILTATPTDKIAQGFQSTTASSQGPIDFVDVKLIKAGAPTGNIWLTIEADTAGNPSGTPLATSDKLNVASVSTTAQWVRVPFRTPFTPTISTQYHLVLQGDYARSDTVFVGWRGVVAGGYASGSSREYTGAAWGATAGASGLDRSFKVYTRLHDAAVTMPALYTQRAKLGWVYNDSGSNLLPFEAVDRRVQQQPVNLGSTTATIPTLFDASSALPPIRLLAITGGFSDTAADAGRIAGVPDGFDPAGPWNRLAFTAAVANIALSAGDGATEGQALYLWRTNGSGTVQVNLRGYQW